MSNVYLYLCEGKNEKKLVKTLQTHKLIKNGQTRTFNFVEQDIAKIQRTLRKSTKLIAVFDTDCLGSTNRLIGNIHRIKNDVTALIFLPQVPNIEGELVYSCSKNTERKLFQDFYHVSNKSEFKNRLNIDKDLFRTLINNNFEIDKLWQRCGDLKLPLELRNKAKLKFFIKKVRN